MKTSIIVTVVTEIGLLVALVLLIIRYGFTITLIPTLMLPVLSFTLLFMLKIRVDVIDKYFPLLLILPSTLLYKAIYDYAMELLFLDTFIQVLANIILALIIAFPTLIFFEVKTK